MPVFEYKCVDCGEGRDIPSRTSGEVPPEVALCPRCQGEMHRIYLAPAIVFKGSGFYSTDNRKGTDKTKEKN